MFVKEVNHMPVGGRISVTPVEGSVRAYRIGFFVGWILAVGVLPSILLWNPGAPAENQFVLFPVEWSIIMNVLSVPLGYFFGYRWLIAPLFAGWLQVGKQSD
jgi:hypothetical protein